MERQVKYYTILRDGTPLKDKAFGITTSSGSVSTNGATNIITISNSGTITITGSASIEVTCVGGGAAGAGGSQAVNGNHGGGGGSVVNGTYNVGPGTYTVTIGAGGTVPGGAGGSSRIVGITPTVPGGAASGNSGNGNAVTSTEWAFDPDGAQTGYDTNYVSGGGGGAGGVGSQGLGGVGLQSTINGIFFGVGGNGGQRCPTQNWTGLYASSAWIDYNNGSPIAINGGLNTGNSGAGGAGGARSTLLSATGTNGVKGIVIIRYTRV